MSDNQRVSGESGKDMDNLPSTSNPTNRESVEEESGVTMVDVLQDEQDLEDDANAVLGGADDKNCTYSQGYMARQPLYACLTCCPGSAAAGVCLACSYSCHDGHEIVELYTKREFCCDCGNEKFNGRKCRLEPAKRALNTKNKYNQNFRGLYCTCARPYPDPEDPVEDTMIQCVVCEDWFHGRHLAVDKFPQEDSYSEMICQLCHAAHKDLLAAYTGHSVSSVTPQSDPAATSGIVDVCAIPGSEAKPGNVPGGANSESTTEVKPEAKPEATPEVKPNDPPEASETSKQEPSLEANGEDFKTESDLKTTPVSEAEEGKPVPALFMVADWRKQLSKSPDCVKACSEAGISFLASHEDTVHHYEEKSKAAGGSQYEEGMKALSEMDRVKQVEAIDGYNTMKSNLMEYLKKFAENGKVVREEDIQEFFQQMSANKRQKTEMPKFCR